MFIYWKRKERLPTGTLSSKIILEFNAPWGLKSNCERHWYFRLRNNAGALEDATKRDLENPRDPRTWRSRRNRIQDRREWAYIAEREGRHWWYLGLNELSSRVELYRFRCFLRLCGEVTSRCSSIGREEETRKVGAFSRNLRHSKRSSRVF